MAINRSNQFSHKKVIPNISHSELVNRAFTWLRFSNQPNCSIVFKERSTSVSETPDVIGFYGGHSYIIECKASRSDFLADKKKFFRQRSNQGMGYQRYYMAPVGLLKAEEIPDGWGLLEVYEKTGNRNQVVKIAKESERFNDRNIYGEVSYLVSAIRRLNISMAVYVVPETSLDSVSSVAENNLC